MSRARHEWDWPDAAVATLRKRAADFASTRTIAEELQSKFRRPITRNMVIGKLGRLGLSNTPPDYRRGQRDRGASAAEARA